MVFFTFIFLLNCSQRPYYPPDSAGNDDIGFPEDAGAAEIFLLKSEKFNEKNSERYVQFEAYITVNSPIQQQKRLNQVQLAIFFMASIRL
jgi:hypothetical protein